MLNLNINPKNTDSIENEILFSFSIKNYQLNKTHTTSNGITQYINNGNRFNYPDEENNTTKGSNDNIFPTMNFQFNEDENEEKKIFFFVTKKNVRADDYREKIARHILNEYYYNKINKLINGMNKKKFRKLPKYIPNEASRKKNKYFLAMTLKEFYETKELYEKNKKEKTFEHNLSIIKKLREDCYKDFREKSGFDDILEMTFGDLVVQYLKSEEYYKYINTLKGKEKENYIHFAEHFIEHYDN